MNIEIYELWYLVMNYTRLNVLYVKQEFQKLNLFDFDVIYC